MDTDADDQVISSSSESETEADEEDYQEPGGNSGEELTLQDDAKNMLLVPPPEDDMGETTQGAEDQDTQYEEEGEGEGAEELTSEQTTDFADRKELEKKKKKKKKKKFLYICLTNCKYDVVRRTARKFGFKEVSEDEDWSLYWTDFSVALERVMDMKKYQKINHFPGMNEICRKDLLARNLNRMMKMFPKEYNIFPKTWCLPADYGDFQAYTRQKKNKTYILKPESGCQGRGIWITRNPKDIKPHEHMICQVYTNKPFLIDGFKFDFRIYTLVTSCDPLRIFVFKDGLVRFATNKYCEPTNSNTENVFMHLTNYAINKNSDDFVRDDDEAGSKRRISTVNRYLQNKGIDVEKLWNDIDDTIIKTLISAHSVLKHNYRTCFPNHVKGSACFEILGFDVLLDRRLRPYVIEVNHSPSFGTDAQLDREIKGTLVWDTLGLINFGAIDRRRCLEEERRRIKDRLLGKNTKKETKEELEVAQQQYLEQLERYEDTHLGNFRRIFPVPGCEKYDKFFHSSGTLFQETAAFRARTELARQQREEIMRKKEKMELMLKKGKRGEGGMRPESPTGRRKRPTWHRNSTFNLKPRFSHHPHHEDRGYSEDIDTRVPLDILEEEELERISGLLQRDNLVRGLGIVEHVYRLLHCTPGTVGIVKPDPKPQPLPLVRPKDRSYYKKLLDRYFGSNHALAAHDQDSSAGASATAAVKSRSRGSHSSAVNRTWNAAASAGCCSGSVSGRGGGGGGGGGAGVGGGGDEAGGKAVRAASSQPFAHVRLAYSSQNNNATSSVQLTHRAFGGGPWDQGSDTESEGGGDHLTGFNLLQARFTGTDSLQSHPNPNPNPNPNLLSGTAAQPPHSHPSHQPFQLANPAHGPPASGSVHPRSAHSPHPSGSAAYTAAALALPARASAYNPPLSPSNISLLSDLHAPQPGDQEAEGEVCDREVGDGGDGRCLPSRRVSRGGGGGGGIDQAGVPRRQSLPSPVVGPFTAPPSSAPPSYAHRVVAMVGDAPLPPRSSRFTVRAPPSSGLLVHSSALPVSFCFSHAASTSFRVPASSLPFSPLLPAAPLAGPHSQSLSLCAPQPGPGGQRWPMKSKSLANVNERTVPAYQRNKLSRKPLVGGVGAGVGRPGMVVQESELRSMAGLMDTEAERNRLLARNAFNYQPSGPGPGPSHPPHQGYTSSGYQSDWRSDNSTPARTRVLSAHRQQRESEGLGVTRFIAQHPSHGLSVVSAPAPVVQRPDVPSPNNPLPRHTVQVTGNGLEMLNSTRSTKSQRIRGATNNMRLRQMEMRENHAFVFS